MSSYFEYEHLKKNGGIDLQQSKQMTGPFAANNYGGNNEAMYGLVGQQIANKRPPVAQSQQQQQNLRSNIIRQQQPIYQSNAVQIYDSVYNHNIPNQSAAYGRVQHHHQTGPQTTRSSGGIYGIYGINGLPASAYTTKGWTKT